MSKLSSGFLPAKGSLPVIISQKHKLNDSDLSPLKKMKQLKITKDSQLSPAFDQDKSDKKAMQDTRCDWTQSMPPGLVWDADDWSCSYDSLFGIIYDIWRQDPKAWSRRFSVRIRHFSGRSKSNRSQTGVGVRVCGQNGLSFSMCAVLLSRVVSQICWKATVGVGVRGQSRQTV